MSKLVLRVCLMKHVLDAWKWSPNDYKNEIVNMSVSNVIVTILQVLASCSTNESSHMLQYFTIMPRMV